MEFFVPAPCKQIFTIGVKLLLVTLAVCSHFLMQIIKVSPSHSIMERSIAPQLQLDL